jgi:hypothetical protein
LGPLFPRINLSTFRTFLLFSPSSEKFAKKKNTGTDHPQRTVLQFCYSKKTEEILKHPSILLAHCDQFQISSGFLVDMVFEENKELAIEYSLSEFNIENGKMSPQIVYCLQFYVCLGPKSPLDKR